MHATKQNRVVATSIGFSTQSSLTRVARRSPGAHRRLELFVSVRGRAHASGPMPRSGRDSGDMLIVCAVPGEEGTYVYEAFVRSLCSDRR
jgi:hypothetical protein